MMGPAGLLCLFVYTHTLLATSVSSEVSVHQEVTPGLISQPNRSQKRQHSTDEMIGDVLHRINDVEDDVIKSRKDVQEVLGYWKALGVSANNGLLPKSRDPCGNENGLEGSNETNWTRFGTSKCVKLIDGLSNFTNANDICREEYRIGEDIAHPVVVSLDSSQKAIDLLAILRLQGAVTSVWINRANESAAVSSGSTCTEVRIPDSNVTVEGVDFKMVECGRVNSVVCQKPVIASYVEIVEQQLEMKEETKKLEKQLKEAKDEIDHFQTIQTIVEALRSEFNSKFCQLELKSTTNDAKLEAEVKLLKRKLEHLRGAMEVKEMRRTSENMELRRSLHNLDRDTSLRVSSLERHSDYRERAAETEAAELKGRLEAVEKEGEVTRDDLTEMQSVVASLRIWRRQTEAQMNTEKVNLGGLVEEVNETKSTNEASLEKLQVAVRKGGEWDLGGHEPFILQKTLGLWYDIEMFRRKDKSNTVIKCFEEEISLNGNNTIDYLRSSKLVFSDEITNSNSTRTVNTQYPYYWTDGSGTSYNTLWLKTDYDNWHIKGWCKSNDISSCDYLHIFARTRTLPSATLEMLRDAVKKFGFPKANGVLVDQTSC